MRSEQGSVSRSCNMGRRKVRVLPEPVWARRIASCSNEEEEGCCFVREEVEVEGEGGD